MSWGRIDDDFAEHDKVDPLSDAAFRLWGIVACWTWKNENLHLRGLIPRKLLRKITSNRWPEKRLLTLAKELVESNGGGKFPEGLWVWNEARDAWQMHDWHKYRPPGERPPEEKSKALSEAGKRGAETRWGKGGKPPPNDGHQPSSGHPHDSLGDGLKDGQGHHATWPGDGLGDGPDLPDPRRSSSGSAAAKDLTGSAAAAQTDENDTRKPVSCPHPLPVQDSAFATWEVNVGLPRAVARAWLDRWSSVQVATPDRKPLATWVRYAVSGLLREWSKDKDGVRSAASSIETTAPVGRPDRPTLTLAEFERRQAERDAEVAKRLEREGPGPAPAAVRSVADLTKNIGGAADG